MTINIKSPNNIKNYSLQRYVPYNKHDVYGTKCFDININDTSVFEILSIKATDKSNSEDKSISLYFRDFSSNNYFAIAKDVPIVESRQELLDESTPVYLDLASGFYQIWAQTNSANNTQSVFLDIEYREYNSTSTNYPTTVNNIITTNDLSYTIATSDTVYVEYQGNFGESDTINLSGDSGNNLDTYFTYPSSVSIANGVITPFSVTNNGSGIGSTSILYASTLNSNQIAININIASPAGQAEYTTPGTYSWTCPAGVTSVCVVCVGGGGGGYGNNVYAGGGGGGALSWCNDIPVVPGYPYTVVVGAGGIDTGNLPTAGGESYFHRVSVIQAGGGTAQLDANNTNSNHGQGGTGFVTSNYGTSATYNGGNGGCYNQGGGGGGAGGYSGVGGNGGGYPGTGATAATAGSGGAGGGGGRDTANIHGAGGGVGLQGQGSNGFAGTTGSVATSGGGGSGGSGGGTTSVSVGTAVNGGNYGGGGAGQEDSGLGGNGGNGAVRIIWGTNRAFPSTNTADV
jgi:hypothetical protein